MLPIFLFPFVLLFFSFTHNTSERDFQEDVNLQNQETETALSLPSALMAPQLELVEIADAYDRPVDIASANDGSKRLFIVDANGYIGIIDSNGTVLDTPFLDIDLKVFTQGERGLLGLVFHPEYATNGFFFVNYTNNSSDTRIARYSVSANDPNKADPDSEKILLAIDQPADNHNGGDMNFSPIDGYLYISSGDGGGSGDPNCLGQDTTTLLGKILRIDVDQNVNTPPYYGVPDDNPFAGGTPGRDEIWAYGLRNPWKCSFDRLTGAFWIADVGQNVKEEVNYQPASSPGGENYGWKVMEGSSCYDPDPIDPDCPTNTFSCFSASFVDPIFDCQHDIPTGCRSLTGGFVYRGCTFPALYGYYITIDYITDNGWLIDSLGNSILFQNLPHNITSFGEGEDGELYACAINGKVYKVRDANVPEKLVLTGTDGFLEGTYEAEDSIIVQGNIQIAPNKSATLIADHILIENTLTVDQTSLIQVERKCD